MGISKNFIEAVVACEKSSDSGSFILWNSNFIAVNFLAQLMWFPTYLPRIITRVGGHRRQPVLNPAMHKASDAGHIEPQPCGIALALAIGGGAMCRRPAPGGTKTALFWRVLDVHKTSQIPSKMALGRT